MTLYRLQGDGLEPLALSTLTREGISERGELQEILRNHPEVLGGSMFIVSDEFSQWEDSRLRIDLLALTVDGTLVVAELKRTEDGGYMDLQAIRYAAMVSSMTFDQVVEAHRRFLERHGLEGDARTRLTEFLQSGDSDEPEIDSRRPRILLVSGNFSKELTTTVLWLNDIGLDVRCVRVRPYRLDNELVLDVQQVIPLPEAEDYLVRIRAKAAEGESRDYPEIPWTEDDWGRLATEVTSITVLALLDSCAQRPDGHVAFSEMAAQTQRERGQVRGDLAAFTRLLKARFGRQNWPIEAVWAAGGEQQMYYRMSGDMAAVWQRLRRDSSENSETVATQQA